MSMFRSFLLAVPVASVVSLVGLSASADPIDHNSLKDGPAAAPIPEEPQHKSFTVDINPLSFIMANLGFLEEELTNGTFEQSEVVSVLRDCQSGVRRIAAIVRDLRTFSRSDADDTPVA